MESVFSNYKAFGSSSLCNGVFGQLCLMKSLQWVSAATYYVESSSLDAEGVREDVDVFVNHVLCFE